MDSVITSTPIFASDKTRISRFISKSRSIKTSVVPPEEMSPTALPTLDALAAYPAEGRDKCARL